MDKTQEQIEQNLVQTFLKNMKFLSSYDVGLYLEIEALSQLINSGEYTERYSLEYIKENKDFDIYDNMEDVYLYAKKPKEFNKNLISRINLDDKNLILSFEDELLKQYDEIEDIDSLKECIEDNKKDILIQSLNKYTKILGYKKHLNPKKIEKFVFFGTLLGTHIQAIAKKMNSYLYLVFEDSLEIFRLSLFTCDYSHLAKRGGGDFLYSFRRLQR